MKVGRDGGYDSGYVTCPCFWGTAPGSIVRERFPGPFRHEFRVLDLGCGEGKNAAHFAAGGATVDAVDCSSLALQNARTAWPELDIQWHLADAAEFAATAEPATYDLVVMYGLLHCLSSEEVPTHLIRRCKELTRHRGANVLCAFNSRSHDLRAHPGFKPLLLPHAYFVDAYRGWELHATDSDLHETHPNNGVAHHHSLTRLIAVKPDA